MNVACAQDTPEVVADIRRKFPDVPIIASGGKSEESIMKTINAGANAITYTPPSTQDLFKEIMSKYRDSLKEKGLYPKSENKQFGLNISLTSNKELIINGTSEDFIELSDLLVSLAMSKTNDHHHIDELTLINDNSSIKEIIIEKK